MWSKNSSSIEAYVTDRQDRLIRQAAFFIALVGGLFFIRRRATLWAQQDRSLQPTVDLASVGSVFGHMSAPGARYAI